MIRLVCRGLKDDTINIIIGGEAGQGLGRSGSLLAKSLLRIGLNVFGTTNYPSLIRGGHNYYELRASGREVYSQAIGIDILIALNKESAILHAEELNNKGNLLIDESIEINESDLKRSDAKIYRVPLTKIVKDLNGPPVVRNTVSIGALTALLDLNPDTLGDVIASTFTNKEVANLNRKAVEAGYGYVKEHYKGFNCSIEGTREKRERLLITGNDAIALGAVSSGCLLYTAYPMTPASAILDYMIAHEKETGMVVVQAESEIASMCILVGAGYAGVRSMTATSGGGFSLMVEALGFAAMTETPVVVNIAQRPGPSTGLATYSAQADLLFALFSSQGEFPRFVIAPGDPEECFTYTKHAFNLAERFQVPVIILTDKYLAESEYTSKIFDYGMPIDRGKLQSVTEWQGELYKRYAYTPDGVSPRLLPGTKGALIHSTSNEHTETGYGTINSEGVVGMVKKRYLKTPYMIEASKELEPLKVYGSSDEITLIAWGGNKGPVLEALMLLESEGIKARFLQPIFMEPFPTESMNEVLNSSKKILLIESNVTAQLGVLIKLHTCNVIKNKLLRYDGQPINPTQIIEKVKEVLRY